MIKRPKKKKKISKIFFLKQMFLAFKMKNPLSPTIALRYDSNKSSVVQ